MMKIRNSRPLWGAFAIGLFGCQVVLADVSGRAYLDYNGNGIFDTDGANASSVDVGVGAVVVRATGVTGLGGDGVIGTADDVIGVCGPDVLTSSNLASLGTYTVSTSGCVLGSQIRIEFSGWQSPLMPGLGSQTTVQFVAGDAVNVNLPLVNPTQFCENNPQLATSCYVYGNQLSGPNAAKDVLVGFPFSAGGTTLATATTPSPNHIAIASQIGSTFGLAFQQSTQTLYAAAYLKHTTGFGPNGPGAIYAVSPATQTATLFADINSASMTDPARPGLFGPGAAGIDPFPAGGAAVQAAVHQVAWGDIDLNGPQSMLYALNMSNLRVYAFPTNGGALSSSAAIQVLPALPFPATDARCSGSRQTLYSSFEGLAGPHAMGLKVKDGFLYVGARCRAQFGDLGTFYVFKYDLANNLWDATPALTFPGGSLSYDVNAYSGQIADIEFAANGDMLIAIRRIASDYTEYPGAVPSTGQLLRACPNAGTFQLEFNGSCGALTGAGVNNTNGPGGGQFFAPDIAADTQLHSQQGGIALVAGRDVAVTTSYDAFQLYEGNASWWNTSTGTNLKHYQVFKTSAPTATTPFDAKAGALGDLEIMCRAAPVEIGNRIWRDLNRNGIQDPNEPALAGVTVELRTALGALLATAVTDSNGQYVFSNDVRGYPVTGNDGTISGGFVEDNQGGLASTAAYRYGVKFDAGSALQVVIPNASGVAQQSALLGLELTTAIVGSIVGIDSNFTGSGFSAVASVTAGAPGANDHTIDAGFVVPAIDLTIAKSVTSSGPYAFGSTATFQLVATNNGPSTAQERIVVKDCLPVGLNFTNASGAGWTCTNTAGPAVVGALTCSSVVTCTRDAGAGALSATASAAPISINTTVAAGASGSLVNVTQVNPAANETVAETNLLGTANGGYESGDPSTGSNNDAQAAITVVATYSIGDLIWVDANNNGQIDGAEVPLSGVKVEVFAASAAGAPTGSALGTVTTDSTGRYRFDGLAAGEYVVVATPPSGYVSSSGTAIIGGTVSSNEFDNGLDAKLASGAGVGGFPSSVVVVGPGDTEPTGERSNAVVVPAAQIAGAGGEASDARSDRTVDFGFYLPFDLRLTKTITSAAPYSPGISSVTYTLRAENLGPGVASANISVRDKLPAGLTATSAGGTDWSCTPTTGAAVEIVCTRAATASPLNAGDAAALITVTASVDVSASGSLVNVAQVVPSPSDVSRPELIVLGTTNSGYEDGSNAAGSNNDDSKSIVVGVPTYSIGNRVWIDNGVGAGIANDGLLNGGELGLNGVTVELLDSAGNPFASPVTTVTSGGGYYRFDNLVAGGYRVRIVKPSGYVNSAVPASGALPDNDIDRDNNGVTETATTISSGLVTLGGATAEPVNETDLVGAAAAGNGPANGGVDAFGNMTVDFGLVQRIDLTIAKTVTSVGPYTPGSSSVTYTLTATNLGPATAQPAIVVKDQLPAGLTAVSAVGTNWACTPQTGAAVQIVCTRAGTAAAIVAGASAETITVTATVDATATGSLLNQAQVNPAASEPLSEAIPLGAANGGYEDGNPTTGSNNDDSKSIALGAVTYSLGNRVWNDINNDGTLNLGEVGLGGITVRLLNASGTVQASTTTDGLGYYQFVGLAAGGYIVEIVPPTGYMSSTGGNGSASGPFETAGNSNHSTFTSTTGTTDHGVAQAGGAIRSGVITLAEGQPLGEGGDHPATLVDTTPDSRSNRNVDFGLYMPASLGTIVWIDNGAGGGVAGDGVRQAGEQGIAGVTVRLLNSTGQPVVNPATGLPVTTVTDANGNYRIANLNPGSYRVEFQFPAQSVWTPTVNPAGSGTPTTNPNPGGADNQRNEMNPTTRITPVVVLGPGQDNPNLDAGVRTYSDTPIAPTQVPTLHPWMLLFLSLSMLAFARLRSSAIRRQP